MRHHFSAVSLVAFGVFEFSTLSARSALAQSTCATNADCVKGWECKVTGGSVCGSACAPGESCPTPPPDCAPQEFKSCVPGPCKADADCASDMVCYTSQVGCDAASPCPAGAACATPACTPTTSSQCLPRYAVPCKVSADCGAGFTCILDANSCACASAGSAPSSDGGAPAPVPPTPCDCPPATTSSCHAVPVTCAADADCMSGWTCESFYTGGACPSVPTPEPGTGGASSSMDGGAPAAGKGNSDPECSMPTTTKVCTPPYQSVAGGVTGGGTVEGVGAPSLAVDGGANNASDSSAGASAPPRAAAADDDKQTSSAGCAVSHGPASSGSAIALFALGFMALGRRWRSAERGKRATPA